MKNFFKQQFDLFFKKGTANFLSSALNKAAYDITERCA